MSLSHKPALIAASLALAASGGGAALLATSAGANTVTGASSVATGARMADASTGTATVSITGPKGKTAIRTVPVSCKVVNRRYVVTAGKPRARSGTSLRISVRDYAGAGGYSATVLIVRESRASFTGHRYAKVPVTLTIAGGSLKFSKTLSGTRDSALTGKTISVAASWTCSV